MIDREEHVEPTGTKTVHYRNDGRQPRCIYTPCIGCGRDFARNDGQARVDTTAKDPEGGRFQRIQCCRDRCGAVHVYRYVNGGFER